MLDDAAWAGALVQEIAYDTEHFTSRAVVVSVGRPGDLALPAPIGGGGIHRGAGCGASGGHSLAATGIRERRL